MTTLKFGWLVGVMASSLTIIFYIAIANKLKEEGVEVSQITNDSPC